MWCIAPWIFETMPFVGSGAVGWVGYSCWEVEMGGSFLSEREWNWSVFDFGEISKHHAEQ